MKFFDKTGAPVDIPDDQAQAAFQSGQYGLPQGAMLPVVGPDGTVGHVAAEQANAAFDDGARIAAPDEVHKAELEATYGGVGGVAAGLGEGAARGLTLGASDPLAIGVAGLIGGHQAAESTRQHLAGTKEANPIASGVGEVAGVIAPSLVTGGGAAAVEGANVARLGLEGANVAREAGVLGRAAEGAGTAMRVAGAPTRLVAEAGAAVERGVGSLLGESASSLGGRLAQQVAKKGAAGATEGALFGAANEIDESYLGNTELTGEKLLAAAGHGALLGGALGSVIGGAGELGSTVLGKLSPKLQGVAEEQAFRSLNSRKAFTGRAAEIPGGTKALGRVLLDEDLIRAGDTIETIAPRITAAKEAAAENLTKVVETVETKGVRLGDALDALEARAKEFDKKLGFESAAAAIREQKNNLARVFAKAPEPVGAAVSKSENGIFDSLTGLSPSDFRGATKKAAGAAINDNAAKLPLLESVRDLTVPLGDLLQARRSLESTINWQTDTVIAQGRKAAGRTLEDIVMDHGEQAAKSAGTTFKDAYQAAKLRFRQLALADEAATDSVDRMGANAAHSLTDKIFGAAGFATGAMHGPLGALGGLAAGQVSKVVRERGNATAAVLLEKLSALSGVERAAQHVDRQIDRAIAGFFSPGERAAPRLKARAIAAVSAANDNGTYEKRVESVARAVANADHHADAAAQATAPIAVHAPETANAFERKALAATAYLQSQIPSGHRDTSSITPQFGKPHVSDAEKARFNRVFDAVHDPASVIDAMGKGTMSRDQVDALKNVYPELYKQIQQRVTERLGNLKKPLGYSQELKLGLLLDVPANATMKPEFIANMQANFASPVEKPSQMPAAPHRSLGNLSSSVGLPGQSLPR